MCGPTGYNCGASASALPAANITALNRLLGLVTSGQCLNMTEFMAQLLRGCATAVAHVLHHRPQLRCDCSILQMIKTGILQTSEQNVALLLDPTALWPASVGVELVQLGLQCTEQVHRRARVPFVVRCAGSNRCIAGIAPLCRSRSAAAVQASPQGSLQSSFPPVGKSGRSAGFWCRTPAGGG